MAVNVVTLKEFKTDTTAYNSYDTINKITLAIAAILYKDSAEAKGKGNIIKGALQHFTISYPQS